MKHVPGVKLVFGFFFFVLLPLSLASGQTPPAPGLFSGPGAHIQRFVFEGNTVFADKDLEKIAGPYTGRFISTEELHRLREKLTRLYVDAGYINSGAVVPDQDLKEGCLLIRIMEGKLTRIDVRGASAFSPQYFKARINRAAGPPLNIHQLRQSLLVLRNHPGIQRLDARLEPDTEPGTARLELTVAEKPPYRLSMDLSNNASPAVGGEKAAFEFAFTNVTGRSDEIYMGLDVMEGALDKRVGFNLPVTSWDTILSGSYSHVKSDILEAPFSNLDLENHTEKWNLALYHPIIRTMGLELGAKAGFTFSTGKTYLLNIPYSFTPASETGETRTSVSSFVLSAISRSERQVAALRASVSAGLDMFGATVSDPHPDGRFMAFGGQAQWIRRLGDNDWQVALKGELRLADDDLLPSEKFSVGGQNSVRGYRKNRLVKDNGATASAELRIPLSKTPGEKTPAHLISFVDWGRAWNTHGPDTGPQTLSSMGVGVKWRIMEKVNLDICVARPFRDFDDFDTDLQDMGVHFNLSCEFL